MSLRACDCLSNCGELEDDARKKLSISRSYLSFNTNDTNPIDQPLPMHQHGIGNDADMQIAQNIESQRTHDSQVDCELLLALLFT